MTRLKVFLFIVIYSCCSFQLAQAQKVERIEPPFWWADMKTELQLLIRGENLKGAGVQVLEEGLAIKAIHYAENPNFLFADVIVSKPGKYTLEITKGSKKVKTSYEILARREGSAGRKGFNTADVIYLIMPDRFANGDTSNDIVKGNDQVLNRKDMTVRHGGDIQGIINHLDYLSDLGITAIWCTPMQEDKLYYHQYGVTDFYKIDPHLGTNELYKKYVEQAHQKGIKVIQDITPNHCGIDHWWMTDAPFSDWTNPKLMDGNFWVRFSLESLSDVHGSKKDAKFCGSSWLFDTMPDMNLENPYVLKYLSQMAIWWVEYANLDGFRVDTFFYMGKKSGKWTEAILNEYPNFTLVGEIWGTDPAVLSYWVGSADNYDGFTSNLPMVMDFPVQAAIAKDLSNKGDHWGGKMREIYRTIATDHVYKNPELSQVIYADNHDMDRAYNTLGKDTKAIKMAMTFIATTRGLPQLFYGTELLFENAADGGDHKVRPDFPGGWPDDELNLFEAKNRTPEQQEMFNHVRTLLHFRKQTPVIHTGKLMHYVPVNDTYTYFRYDDDKCLMVVLNMSESDQPIEWERFDERLDGKKSGKSILDGKTVVKGQDVKVSAKSSMVVYFE